MTRQTIQSVADRFPLAGPLCWILSLQYFIVQLVAVLAWTTPYSWLRHTMSDLGNTACATYSNRPVCSPLHGLVNASLILLGITMVAGVILIYLELSPRFKSSRHASIGFWCLALAGCGTLLVGFFPENSIWTVHIFAASLPFLVGNLGLLILGLTLPLPSGIRFYTILTAVTALTALAFLLANHRILGIGGNERLIAYPQIIWLIVFGFYVIWTRRKRAQ